MSTTQANGKAGKPQTGGPGKAKAGAGKKAGPVGTANGTAAAVAPEHDVMQEPLAVYSASSKPERAVYDKEQEAIKAQLNYKQSQLDKVKGRIADSTGSGPAGERRKALRAEQQELRSKTASFKGDRASSMTELKILQENIQKKIKDMQNAKSKTSYKSVAEIDNRIKDLERQVESGQMRLVDEKRALSEISDLRRSKKSFDSLASQQESIDADKSKVEELRAKLDNPEFKALQDRYSAIQKELDEINAEMDASSASRDKLFEERNKLQEEVNALWTRKKESTSAFKDANDKYFTKANEDRQKRIERQQAERRAFEESKRREANERALEEARAPAFEREIEDCTTLIGYFSRFASGATSVPEPKLSTSAKSGLAGVPQLEVRQAENDIPEGAVVMKKKGEDEESFFAGKGKGKKGKKGAAAASGDSPTASQPFQVPFQTVAALLQFNIEAPFSKDDVPKTLEALKEKKSWFEQNQDRVTKERISAAEDRIKKAEQKAAAATPGANGASEEDATADAPEDGVKAVTDKVENLDVKGEENKTEA